MSIMDRIAMDPYVGCKFHQNRKIEIGQCEWPGEKHSFSLEMRYD